VIRTKPIPVILEGDVTQAVNQYAENYHQYFLRNNAGDLKELDLAPRWGVWPGYGTLSFDQTLSSAQIITDIVEHTRRAIQMGERLGGWQALSEKDLFDMEYWELEQAKLGKGVNTPELRGKIAVVTGAASGIGKACMEVLAKQGAVVVGLDMNPAISEIFNKPGLVGIQANILDEKAVQGAIALTVQKFGGLDILVSNAGIFPASETIENLSADTWEKSLNVNLSSQRSLLQAAIPFLKQGIDPTIIFIGSRNVLAPGPGAAAYSVAKAGLTQLARVAALELAADGIRVNTIHPDCVYDTGIWTADILASRAERYGLTVDEYKSRNLLKQLVTSQEVAHMVAAMAGKLFAKTTGCQLPIDGGNERVI
ncbi:MAG: SDR family oxidoreductase, partial [Microcoleaceae cyanobacterium]